jgi:sugar transferase (PEP-CTERM/EpsH1 system associated)
MESKPKLVVLLSRFPYPLEKGDKLRAYFQLRDLSKEFDIFLMCTSESPVSIEQRHALEPFCKEIHVFKLKRFLIPIFLMQAFLKDQPFQIGYFYQTWIQRKIARLLGLIKPDFVYSQLVRSTEYVKNYHACPKTLDYMDALSKGMDRRAEKAWGIKKWIFAREGRLLSEYERKIFDYFEAHSIISEQDRAFIFHTHKDRITLIPNGVDERFFELQDLPKKTGILFTGNMSYAPNVEAASFLVNEILPVLKHDFPTITCCIAGAQPVQEVRQLATDGVEVTGWVADIRNSYSEAQIFVAPMLIGTGLQNKLLEAMACGLPCVTTELANNALLAEPNREILLAKSANEFAGQIKKLLLDAAFKQSLAVNGQQFVKKHYKWDAINQDLSEMLRGVKSS